MNYSNFYISAKKMLTDSLVSIWFRGKGKEQEYMRRILSEEEPLLSEPVFQSIFPWEESAETFGEHCSKLNILSESFVQALSSDNIDESLRFPLNRHPYKHQTKSWKTMLSDKGKTIVVTSGTGSGKTECFMIPVLQDIAQRNEKDCVQAIFLYPLNALMKSQQKRIHAWCDAIPNKVTYAIYNGDTEKTNRSSNFTSPYFPQLITRPQIRQTPPQVLFTNPTMLNYMLVRAEDKPILEKSQGKLKWILLDEAHTYTGSSAAELSLQLRRVLDAFGVTVEQVNFAVTSATIGDEKEPATQLKLKTFVSQLTGKPIDSIVIIGGKRVIPDMDNAVAQSRIDRINKSFNCNISIADIERIRKQINSSAVLTTKDIVKQLDRNISKDIEKSLDLIDALANKVEGLSLKDGSAIALLPSRAHFFVRSISGVYACVNSECSRHKKYRIGVGSLTTYQNTNCPTCKSKLLEIATCPSCGGIIVVGETSTSKGFRMHANVVDLDNSLFFENRDDDLIESEEIQEENSSRGNENDGFTPFYFAKPIRRCLRRHTHEDKHVFNHEKGRIEIAPENAEKERLYISLRHDETNADLCPHCGNRITRLDYLRVSATQMGRVLSTLLLDNAEGMSDKDAEILYNGKRYITFTDNRQGSARSAMGMNQDVERSWVRSTIFHKLADIRIEKVEPKGLTDDEMQLYNYLTAQPVEKLPKMMKDELARLKAKLDGENEIPKAPEVDFGSISQTLENNADFRKLFKHLKNARAESQYDNPAKYLKALLVDQFGWIPKRANSLENMGVVRLVYPDLKRSKCPALLTAVGCKNEDWQDFLKICIDYLIRGGRHYMISSEYKDFLTQNTTTSAIYPKESDLKKNGRPVSKWPMVRQTLTGVQEDQSRLVLLLCAVLGYNEVETINDEKIANVNSLLTTAWNFITSNILESVDSEHHGYMLDLLGPKVKLQLIDKGYLCPVDNVVVDVTFCGYSPRMNGYIGKENFNRFRVTKELTYPFFPFKSTENDEETLSNWLLEHFGDQKESGVFSNIHERVYAQKPIFIAAEHSAQQSREDLDKYEKEFNEGQLNVLSCSTTMEMGVDIGGINEVVMNNVPPKPANYLQRAGRAGRRNESKALALTFCAPNPIGSYTWNHPYYPMTHNTETPLLKLESRQLVQRHVNALVFSDFVSQQGGIRVTSIIKDFFESTEGVTYYDQFLTHIDKIIGGQGENLDSTYQHLTRGTALANVAIGDAVYATKKDLVSVYNIYKIRLDSLNQSIEALRNEDGSGTAIRALEHQKDNFLKTALLTYLAENSFLPSAGIPTGLVECMLGVNTNGNYPTMHLSQAIAAYAPGSQVVKNEWIYEPAGIILKTKYDDNTSRYILQNCNRCGYTSIISGSAKNDCPKCGGHDTMHGIKDMSISEQRFTEVVEPAAFSVAWGTKPTRKMKGTGTLNFIQPVLLEMEPWEDKSSSAKMIVRCSTPKSEILFYNRGRNEFGYAFCPYCGRMESESGIDSTGSPLAGHKHMSNGLPCPGGSAGGSNIRRHVLLVGRYQTDFVELKFYNADNLLITDSETLYSLGVILSRKLTELLGVNDGEIDFGYNSNSHTIFIYDTALGGAGYSPLLREYKDVLLKMAYDTLKGCNCERACTKCLIDRRSQWYLNYLNRQKALKWLEIEFKSRIAPESVSSRIPDASYITSDFATELYQLTRNKDLNKLYFFVDNNYEDWQTKEFPYNRLINELRANAIDISFVLDNTIDIRACSPASRTIIMSALFTYNFSYCTDANFGSLRPLLSVTFNDGRTKTYFGENLNRYLAASWGSGDVYSTTSGMGLHYQSINSVEMLQNMAVDDGSIMFDTRIKEDCAISSLFNILLRNKPDKWNRIKTQFVNKSVEIEYSDRYLLTPLGCMLFAHFIAKLKQEFSIRISSIKVTVSFTSNVNTISSNPTKICESYRSRTCRNDFLKDSINEIVGITPTINEDGYISHERCITIKSDSEELCIRPDAGIAYGWKPNGRENLSCEDDDFRYNWDLDMNLYNQGKRTDGILYTISFSKR